MLYVLSYQVFLDRRELFSPWKGLCQSSFFIYAHWVIRRPHRSCTNWKLVEKVYNNEYKHNILAFFLFFFPSPPNNNFNMEVNVIRFMEEKIPQCSCILLFAYKNTQRLTFKFSLLIVLQLGQWLFRDLYSFCISFRTTVWLKLKSRSNYFKSKTYLKADEL